MEIAGVPVQAPTTATRSADVSTNNDVAKSTQNIQSQTDTETQEAVSQPSSSDEGKRIGGNVDFSV